MKHFYSIAIILAIVMVISCQKEVIPEVTKIDAKEVENSPMTFNSLDEMLQHIETYNSTTPFVKSMVPQQLSYAVTVMQEDGYDDRPDAIMSEAFGSVLSPDGEAIFGNIAMKLCKYGLLYSSSDHLQDIRNFSSDKSLWDELIPSESFLIPLEDYSNLFRISTSPDIYLCDLFGIADSYNTLDQDQTLPKTKSSDVIYNDYLQRSPFLKQTYTVPNSTDAQRHIFPSDTKVANDTKVYYENFAVYSERGVKTKTVRKKLLGWQKFDNNLTASYANLIIWESGLAKSFSPGWVDVNNTVYDGQSYIIATKVISGLPGDVINMSHSDLVEECNDALAWAKNKGINVSNIDGLRLIGLEDPANVLVRIKDDVRTVYDSKCTIIVNLKPEGSFYTETSSLGAYTILNNAYRIFQVSWAGYSDYNGEKRGTRVMYIE